MAHHNSSFSSRDQRGVGDELSVSSRDQKGVVGDELSVPSRDQRCDGLSVSSPDQKGVVGEVSDEIHNLGICSTREWRGREPLTQVWYYQQAFPLTSLELDRSFQNNTTEFVADAIIGILHRKQTTTLEAQTRASLVGDCLMLRAMEQKQPIVMILYMEPEKRYFRAIVPVSELICYACRKPHSSLRKCETCLATLLCPSCWSVDALFHSKTCAKMTSDYQDVQKHLIQLDRQNKKRSEKPCEHCSAPDPKKRCGQCQKVYYCDAKCQAADWKDYHKKNCIIEVD